MSFHLVLHMPRLVAMVAKIFMCERKVSMLIYYFLLCIFIDNQGKQRKMVKKRTAIKSRNLILSIFVLNLVCDFYVGVYWPTYLLYGHKDIILTFLSSLLFVPHLPRLICWERGTAAVDKKTDK